MLRCCGMWKLVAALLACGLLAGCAAVAERQAAQAAAQKAAMDAADDQQCRDYGARPGSDPYIACRMNIANQRTQIAAAGTLAAPAQQANNQRAMEQGARMMRGY